MSSVSWRRCSAGSTGSMRGRAGSVAGGGASAVSTAGCSGLAGTVAGGEGAGPFFARCDCRGADASDGALTGGIARASGSMGCGRGRRTCVCGMESGSFAAGSDGGGSALASVGCGGDGVLVRVNFISHAESARTRTLARIFEARRMRDASARGHSRRDADDESRPFPRLTGEIDCTIVQLHDAEGHGQADAGASLLGCEIQPENFFLEFGTDSTAGIDDADLGIVAAHRRLESQVAATRHGFNRVHDDVEHRLFQKIQVRADRNPFGLLRHVELDVSRLRQRTRQLRNIVDKTFERNLYWMQFDRPGEIQERLHHAVKPYDL